ncbi:MAG: (2Fe-2S)-binding protein, partial [Deltaproteobacteria bacterium]|nr:(2Fe-2S)-binding protein [Deltaproteobacteria bacterium]
MPTLKINGKEITVEPGTTIMQAADTLGIHIPRFCYHKELTVAGNCRMCLVEIEKNPKLQISCNTAATDGMVVRTDTPQVREAVRGVLELILINHPIDCPVCDQAGECWLQNYYMMFGLYTSRFKLEDKVHKPKRVDLGPIVLDAERCVLCSRCVRFCGEVTKTNEMEIFERGDHSEIRTYPGQKLDGNKYAGNLADICPVGALTSRDFRFRCRAWFLKTAESICPGG